MVIFLECYSSMNYYQFIVNIPFLVALISWVIFWKSFAQTEILDIVFFTGEQNDAEYWSYD